MFGTSGVRGAFGETVTADLALSIGRALAVDGADRVVLGRDPRTTGPLLADALSAGCREYGVDVVDIGVAATPTIARSVSWQDADAGVAITASHNPPQDNGIKLWTPSGMAFDEDRRERIATLVREDLQDATPAAWDAVGDAASWNGANERHKSAIVDAVEQFVDEFQRDGPAASTGASDGDRTAEDGPLDLEVVVDIGNGAGAVTAPSLRALGCSVQTLNGEPDGHFPSRPSEPKGESLGALCAQVAGTDADLGIAHDGDADRAMAVDETGAFVEGDALLALFAEAAVEAADDVAEPRVAVPLNTSLAVQAAVENAGGSVVRTPVGDVFVAERASEDGVVFGGEPSGAWIWPDQTLAPDGSLAACRLAAIVDAEGPLTELVDDLDVDAYPLRRESNECEGKRAVVDAVADLAADRYESVSRLDGVRVETDDGWFLVRASGTQPLVRLTAQGHDSDDADDLLADAAALFEDALEGVQ